MRKILRNITVSVSATFSTFYILNKNVRTLKHDILITRTYIHTYIYFKWTCKVRNASIMYKLSCMFEDLSLIIFGISKYILFPTLPVNSLYTLSTVERTKYFDKYTLT